MKYIIYDKNTGAIIHEVQAEKRPIVGRSDLAVVPLDEFKSIQFGKVQPPKSKKYVPPPELRQRLERVKETVDKNPIPKLDIENVEQWVNDNTRTLAEMRNVIRYLIELQANRPIQF